MKPVVAILALVSLSACAGGAGFGKSGGIATYDDLKAAQEACAAKGGTLKLQKNGDVQYLDDYACEKN
ncbi:MAG: hypothetical protein A2790_11470 [Phenylobacterium sp. RIFCSPHIGHO2_01_FULL_69_31]|jgi:hypothetical protein|uniref:hypothetical protein n=1 Tax=Phenylobacterium sp. RIFCSPHIGHO2_01_FULL_69_31 TaxID=1801944 RepID=UPI0008CAAD33|nr:hypothetical protein [Phenylobacterium sp. RIFCSPHIGHO2_01_FULL_69_31]OHB28037.1 MAG: hypothetical protein A2790_11470 [Phenylobacterium sp. RIFCSPHIGHO2_01_FULL_69_31]